VVDTYECEWKKAVTDPETRKRFRHFVNSGESDSNVSFVEERGQIRPATAEERLATEAKQSTLASIPVVVEMA
jgi:nitrite reductase (NADH) large subunit